MYVMDMWCLQMKEFKQGQEASSASGGADDPRVCEGICI